MSKEMFTDVDWSDVDGQIEEVEKSYQKKSYKDDRFLVINKSKKDARGDSETYWLYFIPKFVKVPSLDGKKEVIKAQKGVMNINRHKFEYEVDKADGSGKQKKWVNFVCPKTFDENAKCFCCEVQSKLYASELVADKDEAKKLRAKTTHVANVLVLRNNVDMNQENKVKIFEFTYQINEKINKTLAPTAEERDNDPTLEPINIWSITKTAMPFKFRVDFEAGKNMPSYVNSGFEKNYLGALKNVMLKRDENNKLIKFAFTGDKTMEEIGDVCMNKAFDLFEVIKEKEEISYDETKKKLSLYLGISSEGENEVAKVSESELFNKEKDKEPETNKSETKKENKKVETKKETEENLDSEMDDLLSDNSDIDDLLGDI